MISVKLTCCISGQTDYPSGCNAVENLIVHTSILSNVWPEVAKALVTADVQLLCDEPTLKALTTIYPPPQNFSTKSYKSDGVVRMGCFSRLSFE